MLNANAIQTAADLLRPHLHQTPSVRTPWLDDFANGAVICKLENMQRTGSFKFRGAANYILQLDESSIHRGVVTASAGNHGLGVAEAAKLRDCKVKVFVPIEASPLKISKLKALDAEVISEGADYDESEMSAKEYAARQRLKFIHPGDDDWVIAGQGTVGLELVMSLSQAGVVLVPIGGGGLLSGIALAVKSKSSSTKVIGVQSQASPAMHDSLRAGKVVETPISATIADGLAGRFVTDKTLAIAQKYCDDVELVAEENIRKAMRALYDHQGWRVEGSAAVGIAAILEGKINAGRRTCVVVITGGNISEEMFYEQIKNTNSSIYD